MKAFISSLIVILSATYLGGVKGLILATNAVLMVVAIALILKGVRAYINERL
jgi:hypothetical protein